MKSEDNDRTPVQGDEQNHAPATETAATPTTPVSEPGNTEETEADGEGEVEA